MPPGSQSSRISLLVVLSFSTLFCSRWPLIVYLSWGFFFLTVSLVDPTSCPNPSLLVSDSHVPPESKDLPVPRDDVVFQDLGQFMRVRQLSYGVQMRHLTQVSSTLYTCYSLLVRPFIHARVVFNQRAMIHYFKEPRNIIARSLQNSPYLCVLIASRLP